ncbi:MAG TPA: class F sortase [Dehalococcoidia bacterium]|nr:class F sortase [Dehalococcoidia bacterium]
MKFFTEASPARKGILAAGVVAFIAGVILISVAALSVLGSDDEPDIEVRDIQSPTPTLQRTPTPNLDSPTPAPTPPPPAPLAEGQYAMIIDKLGVNAPVQTYGLDARAAPEVPTGADAADVVAWYNFSAHPGTGSNAVFAGHVTWFGPGVFFQLTSIANGDQIKLVGQDGTELLYTVNDIFQVDANDPDALQVMSATDQDVITIITCDGDFVDTNDPVFGGDYSHRLVVRAERTDPAAVAAES